MINRLIVQRTFSTTVRYQESLFVLRQNLALRSRILFLAVQAIASLALRPLLVEEIHTDIIIVDK